MLEHFLLKNEFYHNMNIDNLNKEIQEIYEWLDEIPLSRPKRNIARDFSDGVLMAELLKYYYPKYVNKSHYISGCSIAKKIDNWCTLNCKVFSKIDLKLSRERINKLAYSQPGEIEKILKDLRKKIIRDKNSQQIKSLLDKIDEDMDMLSILSHCEENMNEIMSEKILAKLKKELQEKTNAINTLIKKVQQLESILKLRDQQIESLMAETCFLKITKKKMAQVSL